MIRRWIQLWTLIAIAASIIILFGEVVIDRPVEPEVITYLDIYDMAWADTCRVTRYNCENIARPTVMYQDLNYAQGTYYCGRDVVLDAEVNPVADGADYAVLVHEYVHYIQISLYGVRCPFPSGGQKCLYEFEAWTAQQDIKEEQGIERSPIEKFRSSYNCQQYD